MQIRSQTWQLGTQSETYEPLISNSYHEHLDQNNSDNCDISKIIVSHVLFFMDFGDVSKHEF